MSSRTRGRTVYIERLRPVASSSKRMPSPVDQPTAGRSYRCRALVPRILGSAVVVVVVVVMLVSPPASSYRGPHLPASAQSTRGGGKENTRKGERRCNPQCDSHHVAPVS